MITISSFLAFIGCKTKQEKFLSNHSVLFYKTNAFDSFLTNAKIKPKEALNLVVEYSKNNNITKPHLFYFVIDKHYVFSYYINKKIPEVCVGGLWVDSETGRIKKVEDKTCLKAYDEYDWSGN